jgi:lysozyme
MKNTTLFIMATIALFFTHMAKSSDLAVIKDWVNCFNEYGKRYCHVDTLPNDPKRNPHAIPMVVLIEIGEANIPKPKPTVKQKYYNHAVNSIKKLPQDAYAFIKRNEGLDTNFYPDAGGYSICYGYYMGRKPYYRKLTVKKCDELFDIKTQEKEAALNKLVKRPLTLSQRTALLDHVYQFGYKRGGFAGTSLLKYINAGNQHAACNEFKNWRFVNGKHNQAVLNRSMKRKKLFCSEPLPKNYAQR